MDTTVIDLIDNPAEEAAKECLKLVTEALEQNSNFLLEAGAGAGKTYTLIKSLKFLIERKEREFRRFDRKIACITYTNVARDEIKSRTDNHPIVYAETIHAFSWGLVKDFQKKIRSYVPELTEKWRDRCELIPITADHVVIYDLGYPKITEKEIFLHHDDVIRIMARILSEKKFVNVLKSKFPVILIDEYQDTSKELAESIVKNLVEPEDGPLVAFFGDHWQKIYGSKSCGLIEAKDDRLRIIGKHANFRSDRLVVESLNRLRPSLKQHFYDPHSEGQISIYHSNKMDVIRRTGAHWQGDLPANIAHQSFENVKKDLCKKGWDFTTGDTKVLMLTNNLLASELGFGDLLGAFKENDDLLKKGDPFISFFVEVFEPACQAFEEKKYGLMFEVLKTRAPRVSSFKDKSRWDEAMKHYCEIRRNGLVKEVVEALLSKGVLKLPEKVLMQYQRYEELASKSREGMEDDDLRLCEKLDKLYSVRYVEVIYAGEYIDDKTLFSTKHGVKGAEFENVLVVLGRGWNQYNWEQMLDWFTAGVPQDKMDTYERSRNLFYVACSRARKRLALVFTQYLNDNSLVALTNIFQVPLSDIPI